jgi:hypothetical protein
MTFVNYCLQERFGSLSCRAARVQATFRSIGYAFGSGKFDGFVGQAFLPVYVDSIVKRDKENPFLIVPFSGLAFSLSTS